jgi:cell wall-associated NlpC family hydrolase
MNPRTIHYALIVIAALCLQACATLPQQPISQPYPLTESPYSKPKPIPGSPAETSSSTSRTMTEEIVMRALSHLGVRYRYGGSNPKSGFDCSGFIRWVFRDASLGVLPRSSYDMARMNAPSIKPDNLVPGDLLFFKINGKRISHVGLYVGDNRFVHAPSRGGRVRIDELADRYWRQRYVGAKRLIKL